jgi:hypothetical protein
VPFFPKTFTTKNRSALGGTEGHGCFFAALRAHRVSFNFGVSGASGGSSKDGYPLCLAGFAAFWFVSELLVVEKKLFARGKNEVAAAVNALQCPVLEFHCEAPLAQRIAAVSARACFLAPT